MRSECVDNTTIVSLRVTPSMRRIRSIKRSSVSVLSVLHLQHQRVLTRHVMTLEHVPFALDLLLEGLEGARVADRDADEGGDVLAERARVEQRRVAADHAAVFELLDALHHRRRRETDLLADLRERLLAVVLQRIEDGEVGDVPGQDRAGWVCQIS